MTTVNLKASLLSSFFWTILERGGVSGVQFIIQIILARLLLPEDFGIIALILVFIQISQSFVHSGFGQALIQKKDVTDEDYSSVFYLTLCIALVFYCILYLSAPFIAGFFSQPLIAPVIQVLGISLFFGAVNIVQNAIIARTFQFRKLFFSSLGAIIFSGTVGLAMAYTGCGVWSLVGLQITSIVSLCAIMWVTVQWRPKLLFSLSRLKILFSFGWKLLVSGLIDTSYNNLSTLVIGKIYPASMLGYYTKGQEFPNFLVGNINSSIQAVMFPAYSRNQDNKPLVMNIMRRGLKTSSFLVFPAMAGLAAIAEPLVKLLLTDKWLMAVPFLQIFCAVYALWPIHTVNLQVINSLGRSDIFLKLEVVKKVVGISVLAITILIGIYAIALGMVFTGFIATFINSYPNKKLLNYSFVDQWKDLMPASILSLVMFGVVYSILLFSLPAWPTLILQIIVGVAVYGGLAWLLRLDSLVYVIDTMNEYITGRNK